MQVAVPTAQAEELIATVVGASAAAPSVECEVERPIDSVVVRLTSRHGQSLTASVISAASSFFIEFGERTMIEIQYSEPDAVQSLSRIIEMALHEGFSELVWREGGEVVESSVTLDLGRGPQTYSSFFRRARGHVEPQEVWHPPLAS